MRSKNERKEAEEGVVCLREPKREDVDESGPEWLEDVLGDEEVVDAAVLVTAQRGNAVVADVSDHLSVSAFLFCSWERETVGAGDKAIPNPKNPPRVEEGGDGTREFNAGSTRGPWWPPAPV